MMDAIERSVERRYANVLGDNMIDVNAKTEPPSTEGWPDSVLLSEDVQCVVITVVTELHQSATSNVAISPVTYLDAPSEPDDDADRR